MVKEKVDDDKENDRGWQRGRKIVVTEFFLFVVSFQKSWYRVGCLLFVFVFVSEKLLQSFFVEQICSDMVFCRV